MEPFPPPDSIGRDGVFLGVITGQSMLVFALLHIFVNVGRMKVGELHSFHLSPPEARHLQEELTSRVVAGPALDLASVRYAAGADVSTQKDMAYATVVVLEFPGLSLVEVRGFEAPLRFPYVPGLLSFREVPSVVGALEKVETDVDAQGQAHPRRMGLASHLGLLLDVPTVGCAKSRLVGSFQEPGKEKGSATD